MTHARSVANGSGVPSLSQPLLAVLLRLIGMCASSVASCLQMRLIRRRHASHSWECHARTTPEALPAITPDIQETISAAASGPTKLFPKDARPHVPLISTKVGIHAATYSVQENWVPIFVGTSGERSARHAQRSGHPCVRVPREGGEPVLFEASRATPVEIITTRPKSGPPPVRGRRLMGRARNSGASSRPQTLAAPA